MRSMILLALLVPMFGCAHAAPKGYVAPATEAARPADRASWTTNLDLKDWDSYGLFVGRELHDGQYKAGPTFQPFSVYRVSADGWAEKWFHAGVLLLTNAEKLNATFGPTAGIDLAHWGVNQRLAGGVDKAAEYLWKPLRLASVTATVDFFGGWTPIHTSDVHSIAYGFGARLSAKFLGGQSAMDAGAALLKGGL